MQKVDLFADIVPGRSAAGFLLGLKRSAFSDNVDEARVFVRGEGKRLMDVEKETEGWLIYEDSLMYCRGAVRLDFNERGTLYAIYLGPGYRGRLFGEIEIGSELDAVRKYCDLEYDDGDEMYYPVQESGVEGVSFYAIDKVHDICVHDWDLMRSDT